MGGIEKGLRFTDEVTFIEEVAKPGASSEEIAETDSEVAAFLFWSRTPFVECGPDGFVVLRDARFYDPRARDRFSVALPDVECLSVEP